MDHWIQAIYEATGIPLREEELELVFDKGEWWILLHDYPVLPVGSVPDPNIAITSMARAALAQGMMKRLSEIVPHIRDQIETLDAERAQDVTISVVNVEETASSYLESIELERGWPHFLLRLSTGGFDVEIDLTPYVPADPYDFDEVRRQAEVILQVARSIRSTPERRRHP